MAFVRYVTPPTPAPLSVTRKPGTRIDAALAYDPTLRALDTVFDGTDFVLDETPASVLLGSLLVDRRAHPDDTWPQPVPDWANPSSLNARKGWVGDALDQNGLLAGSRLWELDRRLSVEQTRSDCQDYLVEAVQPLESQRGYAIKIQVDWEMPQILGYSVTVGSTTIQ
ncbi:MAG: phage GP46 family protein, partial [Acidobacteriota bacterium]|nr:phage GP46 family protein [Acidobacteriota bacterium]